jgi:hypothetical protein
MDATGAAGLALWMVVNSPHSLPFHAVKRGADCRWLGPERRHCQTVAMAADKATVNLLQ